MRRDDGTVLVQALGGALLAIVVTITFFDLGSLYVARTRLLTVANDVAIEAATAIDVEAIYASGVGEVLALDPSLASQRAAAAISNATDPRLRDLRLDRLDVHGGVVRVEVSAAVPNPLGPIAGQRSVRMRASASASTQVRF